MVDQIFYSFPDSWGGSWSLFDAFGGVYTTKHPRVLFSGALFPYPSDAAQSSLTSPSLSLHLPISSPSPQVFQTYASRRGVDVSSLRFLLDGERIDAAETPKSLELDDQDQIDCMLEQTGGYF